MSCLGECVDLGPPPDAILFMPPPPPAPDLLLRDTLPANGTPCEAARVCDTAPWGGTFANRVPARSADHGDFVEMSRKDLDTWSVSGIDDTWLLVLVVSSIGVLLLGALLAMFLLKCREMNVFGGGDCSMNARDHRHIKTHLEQRECSSVSNINGNKIVHPADSVLYHGAANLTDNRLVWAALTPRGTQHFVSENYPRDLIDYGETEDHYETIDNLNSTPVMSHSAYHTYRKDYDYEDPTPLIESYQMSDIESSDSSHYQILGNGNADMRCASLGLGLNSLRRPIPINRPRVSSPTRIEHPNLPPLNLYPQRGNTLKKNSTLSYRAVDTSTLPKYGM